MKDSQIKEFELLKASQAINELHDSIYKKLSLFMNDSWDKEFKINFAATYEWSIRFRNWFLKNN